MDLKHSTLPCSSARASRSRAGSTSRPTEPPPPPPGPPTGTIPKKKKPPVKEEVTEVVVEPVMAPGAGALPPPAPVLNSLSEARAILPMYSLTHRSGVGHNSSAVRPRPEMFSSWGSFLASDHKYAELKICSTDTNRFSTVSVTN